MIFDNKKILLNIIIIATIFFLIYLGLLFYLYKGGNSNEAYPNKPITIIVHSKPGSSVDLMSRKGAELARKYCKEPFVIENHPGTQGIVAMQYVMDRKTDGYTLLGVTKSFLSTLVVNKSNVAISDFLFLSNMISDPEAIITNKESGLETLKIRLPTFLKQTKIANILSSADKEIDILEQQLEKLKAQKKGLMQVLLSGQKRVKLLN